MGLREEEVHARTSLTEAGDTTATTIAATTYAIHANVLHAREEILNARAHLEGDYVPPVSRNAAALAVEALTLELEDISTQVTAALNSNDPIAQARALKAHRHLTTALNSLSTNL
jgi:hypothetical protein